MDTKTLHNGLKMPQEGFGVFQIPEDEDAKQACLSAFRLGCRHIDSAHQKDNIDIFDFELTADEMEKIKALDQGKRYWTLTLEQQEEKFLNIKLAE